MVTMTAALCLSLTIYYEARGENIYGQLAVAQVVMNRVENSRYPDTVCGVVTQRKQFIYLNGTKVEHLVHDISEQSAWRVAQSVANSFVQGHRISLDATHYHTIQINPSWANHPSMMYLGTIGNHKFYKEN